MVNGNHSEQLKTVQENKMKVKDLVQKNIAGRDFPCCTLIYKNTKEGLKKVYDSIDTDGSIKLFLSKQVDDWTGVYFPSFFTLSIILKG